MRGMPTMLGAGLHGDQPHRSLSIEKVENGYLVDATFSKHVPAAATPDAFGSTLPAHDVVVTERRVFYTPPEVVLFVKDYLEAPAERLRADEQTPPTP